ncbi:hypothetical protein ACHHYP_20233 [Achlya hypogyna]|uniref:Tc1-like transposase DDE domain-containing protein n=1 Tax=Achlya hypogyna TaxID=1202772 RepID=A0A1V9YWI6_ACHHY|nr:hypothetical protein ACHHYP_20233 [Achlya hypogyna]
MLAAFDATGFFAWTHMTGTFDRTAFHEAMRTKVIPYLNSWPHPRSILVLDNAKIHMYKALEDMVHSREVDIRNAPKVVYTDAEHKLLAADPDTQRQILDSTAALPFFGDCGGLAINVAELLTRSCRDEVDDVGLVNLACEVCRG